MGLFFSNQTKLTQSQMQKYVTGSFLTWSEVTRLYKRFNMLDPGNTGVLTREEFSFMNEMVHNPFALRIFEVFTNDSNEMGFEHFLEFASVFSIRAPVNVKLSYAFRIYDIDCDGVIGAVDLRDIIDTMVGDDSLVSNEEKDKVVEHVLSEIKSETYSNSLTKVDFFRMAKRVPRFMKRFSISIV